MAHWKRIAVVAGLAALGPAVVALSEAGAAVPADPAAIEDALLVRLGDVLAPSVSAEANAAAIAGRLRRELRGCGVVQVAGARVSVEASGCTLSDGLRLGEPLSLVIHRSARGLTVVMTDGAAGAPARASTDGQVPAGAVTARR